MALHAFERAAAGFATPQLHHWPRHDGGTGPPLPRLYDILAKSGELNLAHGILRAAALRRRI
jgi:hypothetical protein